MAIIFLENGRLGNQLFQYHGVRKYYPEELIIFIGFTFKKMRQKSTNCKFGCQLGKE